MGAASVAPSAVRREQFVRAAARGEEACQSGSGLKKYGRVKRAETTPGKKATKARERAPAKGFHPDMLDRSVIAIPLLKQIETEVQEIAWVAQDRPELLKKFNCAIIYREDFPGGFEKAITASLDLLGEAAEKIGTAKEALKIEPPEQAGGMHYSFANFPARLVRKVIALNSDLKNPPIQRIVPSRFEVIIDPNLRHVDGREGARAWVQENIPKALKKVGVDDPEQGLHLVKTEVSNQYLFARLEGRVIKELVRRDEKQAHARKAKAESVQAKTRSSRVQAAPAPRIDDFLAIHCIWPDFPISACITRSLATVKADAAQNSFAATGEAIAWAVMDSGIEAGHPHFDLHRNVDPASNLHQDFTGAPATAAKTQTALTDLFGHGTHVAGIIAGEQKADGTKTKAAQMIAVTRAIKGYEEGNAPRIEARTIPLEAIRGMAPRCKLVSLKVLDDDGHGEVSNLIAAIAHIQEKNGHGRHLQIHGVNISLGYEFEPEWFACGQSPICVEINRLVRSGVVVVVAAGNTGYGALAAQQRTTNAGMEVTINDPGNAELAITVGSTHREMPHVYGVSFFSSKGPTGDGRLKPDLVAPGEKILSAATGQTKAERAQGNPCTYVEDSGTSMAAPHVSGVVAAFLSVRREFIGEPEKVKEIFVSTATDLKRDRYFQGAGLIDLMRAIQSV